MTEKLSPASIRGEMRGFTARLPTYLWECFNAVLGDRVKNRVLIRIVEAWVAKSEAENREQANAGGTAA